MLIMCVSKYELAIAECMSVCVCVCVRERERERGGAGERGVKEVGEQEDVLPIIPIQRCEVS